MANHDSSMVPVMLGRIVIQDGEDRQYIFLHERGGQRGFPIVIGDSEAKEIHRVVSNAQSERPLTHQLLFNTIVALGGKLERVDIVDVRQNTYIAQLVLSGGPIETAVVDARPSDAIALALRAKCPMRVSEAVLRQACTDENSAPPSSAPGETEAPDEE